MTQQDRDRQILADFYRDLRPNSGEREARQTADDFVQSGRYKPIPSDTIDKTDPNLSKVSDKQVLSVETLIDFIDWLDNNSDVSFCRLDGVITQLAGQYLAERNNSRKVTENDTFRK